MTLTLVAPMAGWAAPLDEAPDPVFAGRMLGDGVAIDPVEGVLRAPCDGVVLALPRSRHAVTFKCANGAVILMHVGLETVALSGEGFEAHVAEGQAVQQGDALLSFDLDLLAQRARSLITPIVVTDLDAFEIESRVTDRTVRAGELLMTVRARLTAAAMGGAAAGAEVEVTIPMPLAHGLHARPAARLAACVQSLAVDVELSANGRKANGRSAVALMALGVTHGQAVTVRARGAGAEKALLQIEELLRRLAAEEPAEPVMAPRPASKPPEDRAPGALRGVAASPGLAIGITVRLRPPEPAVDETSRGVAAEARALDEALQAVGARIAAMAGPDVGPGREILAAHQAFLDDPELRAAARKGVEAGKSAGAAWRDAIDEVAAALTDLGERRFVERVEDLKDLRRQVLFALSGEEPQPQKLPHGAILIAEELLPSELMGLDASRIAGFCTARGGATSHVAILAQAMGVPALAGVGRDLLAVPDGASAILDADVGLLRVGPDQATFAAAQSALARREERRLREQRAAAEPCRTADGVRIEVFANLQGQADAETAVRLGAEGCGLFRTEFLYLDRRTPPTEDEQAAAYQAVANALQGRPLVIRTLDAGGDKPLAFAPAPLEINPALGLRGVRAGLRAPELLRSQLKAILRVRPAGRARILLPMVCDLSDLRAVRALLDELDPAARVEVGVMIETPASALLADQLAREADFLSIGTNDLTQYVLAMDREHPELAARLDALHPAVLRLIARTAEAGASHGRVVAVCGGLASDPLAAPLLVGMGVTELSAAPAAIPTLKARLRNVRMEDCRACAHATLELTSPAEVRALLRERLPFVELEGASA